MELRTNREHDVSPHPFATWVRDALEVAYDHVRESLNRTAARRKRLYDTKAVIGNFRWDRITICNELGDLGVGWSPNRPTTAIRFSKEHRHNPVMA